MSESSSCLQCGAALPDGGICAVCAADFLQGESTVGPGETFVPPGVAELALKFPRLEILELIGRGGMGAVYRARQRELDRVVALKILPPGIGDDPAFAERFAREARALAKLSHPNIVTLFEYGRAEDGPYFFLMEFVNGVNLRQLLLAEHVSPREALEIVPQICDALQFAHDHGIVHRDIKPENILLDRRGRVKVADFGLAKLIGVAARETGAGNETDGELTGAGKILGTPSYMAPEQTAQPDTVDHRADIYALGVVFYQLLTGELPDRPIEPPSHKVRIDVRLDEVVLRALEKDPHRRYAQASGMKTAVEALSPANIPPGRTGTESCADVVAHMNARETWESVLRALMFTLWNVCTFFLPAFIVLFWQSNLWGGLLAVVVLGMGLSAFPIWRKLQFDFLASTTWATQRGVGAGMLRAREEAGALSVWLRVAGGIGLFGALLAADSFVPNGVGRLPMIFALFLVFASAMKFGRSIFGPLRWWGLAGFFVILGGLVLLGGRLVPSPREPAIGASPRATTDKPASVPPNAEVIIAPKDPQKLQNRLIDLDLAVAVAQASFRPKHPSRLAIEAERKAFQESHPGLRDSAFWDLVAQRQVLLSVEEARLASRYRSAHPRRLAVRAKLEALAGLVAQKSKAP